MSESNSIIEDEQAASSEKEQFVSKKAYEDVSSDMHKYKSKVKEAEARSNEYEARLKAIEEEGLKKNQQWEELYNKANTELENERQSSIDKDKRLMNTVKRNALKQELGSGVKDEYLKFANIDAIEFDDNGHLVKDSLQAVANNFRQEHSQLIPTNPNANPTGMAPADGLSPKKEKTLNEMSLQEKIAYMQEIADKKGQ